MQKLLVDTAAWAALELANDHNYSAAFEFRQEAGRTYRWVTTNWIIWETVTLLQQRGTHTKATQFYERVWQSASLDIVQIVPPHETLAWDIFRQYADKSVRVRYIVQAIPGQAAFTLARCAWRVRSVTGRAVRVLGAAGRCSGR